MLVFSPSRQPGRYARWHTWTSKILLANSIGKNGNWTTCNWKVHFFIFIVATVDVLELADTDYPGVNKNQGLFHCYKGCKECSHYSCLYLACFFKVLTINATTSWSEASENLKLCVSWGTFLCILITQKWFCVRLLYTLFKEFIENLLIARWVSLEVHI